jgi:RHS repeat-associated protein
MTSAALGPLGLTMLLSYRKRTRRNRALLGFLLALSVAGALAGGMALFNPKSVSAAPLPGAPTTVTYEYDPLYRLTGSQFSTDEKFTYTYDAAGNRLTQTTPGGQTTYTYDEADRVESLTQINVAQSNVTRSYQWDANGNLLSDGERSFAYDSANQLTQAISGTVTVRYSYSGDGLRLMQDVNGALTRYAQDIASALPQVIFEANPQAQVTYVSAGSLTAAYDAGQWAYQLPDALGSVRQQTDADGLVRMARGYAPFGETLWQTGKPIGSFGYAGEEEDKALDAVAGLVYLRSRYYDPATGRFITRDSYPATAPIPQTLHRYAYVGNDPVNRTDPSGQTWSDAFANVPHEVARRPQPKINRRAKAIAYQSMQKGGLTKDQPYDPYLEPVDYDQYLSRKAYFYEKDIEKKKQDPNYEKQRSTEKAFEVAFRYSNLAAGKPVEENPFANSKERSFVKISDKDTGEYETYYVDSENQGHLVRNDPSYYTKEAREERAPKIEAKNKEIAAKKQELREEALNKYPEYPFLTDQEFEFYEENRFLPARVDQRDVVDADGRITSANVYDHPPVGSQHPVRQVPLGDGKFGYIEMPEGGKLASEQTKVESICNWVKNASEKDRMDALVQTGKDLVQDPLGTLQKAGENVKAVVDEVMADPGAAVAQVGDMAWDMGKREVDKVVTEITEVTKPVVDAIYEVTNYATAKVNEAISEVRNAMEANGLGDVVTFLESPQTRMAFGIGVIVGSAILTGGTSLIYAGAGMALAGAMNYGTQVYNNYQNHSANPWQNVNLYSIGQSMFEGAVSGSFGGATNAFFGGGIVGNALQSIASQPITNYVMGRPVMQDVLDPGVILQNMVFDKVVDVGAQVIGAGLSAIGKGISKGLRSVDDLSASAFSRIFREADDIPTGRKALPPGEMRPETSAIILADGTELPYDPVTGTVTKSSIPEPSPVHSGEIVMELGDDGVYRAVDSDMPSNGNYQSETAIVPAGDSAPPTQIGRGSDGLPPNNNSTSLVPDDLTPNEREFLRQRPDYADKLLKPENRPMLSKLADNYAASPSDGMQVAIAEQDAYTALAAQTRQDNYTIATTTHSMLEDGEKYYVRGRNPSPRPTVDVPAKPMGAKTLERYIDGTQKVALPDGRIIDKVTSDMDPAFGISADGKLMSEQRVLQIGDKTNGALGYDVYQHGDHVNFLNRVDAETFDKMAHYLDEPVFEVTPDGLIESGTMRDVLERQGISIPQKPQNIFYVAPSASNGVAAPAIFTQRQWDLIGTSPHAKNLNPYIGEFGLDEALARTPRHWTISSQQSGSGVVFSDPSPSGLGPDEFRIKPANRQFEPWAYDYLTGEPRYAVGRVGIHLSPGDPRADQWGVGYYNNANQIINPNPDRELWNIVVHMPLKWKP